MKDYVKNTCRIGQGISCCRYLVMGPGGFECVKKTSLKATLDFRVASGTITAQADNCEGYTSEDSLQILN